MRGLLENLNPMSTEARYEVEQAKAMAQLNPDMCQRYADVVAKEFNPKQILFFGSYLYGSPEENSDIDVAVVFDKDSEPENWLNAAARMHAMRWGSDFIDIEPHLLEWDASPRSFTRHVQEVGKVLYQR